MRLLPCTRMPELVREGAMIVARFENGHAVNVRVGGSGEELRDFQAACLMVYDI